VRGTKGRAHCQPYYWPARGRTPRSKRAARRRRCRFHGRHNPPRGGSPCIITRRSPPSGWPEDLHLQTAEHAQHTTARRTLRVDKGRGSRLKRGAHDNEGSKVHSGCLYFTFPDDVPKSHSGGRDAACNLMPRRSNPVHREFGHMFCRMGRRDLCGLAATQLSFRAL
jgi:hypothetical protein